jgi:hypothetical protein
MITPARDATALISRSASQLPMPAIIRSSRTMFSEPYDSRKAHEAGFDAHLRELWHRLLGRPVSEYGTYCLSGSLRTIQPVVGRRAAECRGATKVWKPAMIASCTRVVKWGREHV